MRSSVLCFGEPVPGRPDLAEAFSEGKAAATGKPRIVIIEDEFFVAWNLQAVLEDMNFGSCEIASDARSGVDLALAQEADLLLVDMNLGDGPDGVEAVRRIREHRKEVAAIFITAYTDDANLGRIRQVAPHAPVLSKPVSPDLLLATIRTLFPAPR
jgi:DNA-binding response OmpR family regulator